MTKIIALMVVVSLIALTGCRFASVEEMQKNGPYLGDSREGWIASAPTPITGANGLYLTGIVTASGVIAACTVDRTLALNEHVNVVRVNVHYSLGDQGVRIHHFDWVVRATPDEPKPEPEPQHH